MEVSEEPEPGSMCSEYLIILFYMIHSASTDFYSKKKKKRKNPHTQYAMKQKQKQNKKQKNPKNYKQPMLLSLERQNPSDFLQQGC